MKAQPIDRLLTILLGFNLVFALWWIATTFTIPTQAVVNVF